MKFAKKKSQQRPAKAKPPLPAPASTQGFADQAAPTPPDGHSSGRVWTLVLTILIPCMLGLLGVAFVSLEKGAIYLSDFATYWSQVASIANDLRTRGLTLELVKVLYQSVGANHYNFLPSIPLVPFQFLGLSSRAAFIGAIALLYGGAAVFACRSLVAKFLRRDCPGWIPLVGAGLAFMTTTVIWWPIYRGYVDACGLACVLASIAVLFDETGTPRGWKATMAAGFLMGFSVILRAYLAFYVIAFCFLFTIAAALAFWRADDRGGRQKVLKYWGAFALGVALNGAVFPQFVVLSLKMDHGIHAAFLSGRSFWEDVWYLCVHFGAVPIVLCAIALFCCIKGLGFRPIIWTPFGASALGGVLFMRDQFFGEHHLGILLLGFLTVVCAALGVALNNPTQSWHKAYLSVFAIAALGCLSDLHGAGSDGVFNGLPAPAPISGEAVTRPKWWTACFGHTRPLPMVRQDLPELARMYAYLDELIARDPNARIYVLASGWSLSDMVIYASLLPSPGLQLKSVRNLLPVHQVDSRDGPPSNLLAATYVLTSETLEIHLRPETQKCVSVPWLQFHEERGYARGFEKLPEKFHLNHGVEAVVFKRTRASFPLEVKELEQDLRAAGLLK